MLRNNGRILKNGNNIFKAQVVNTYIQTNAYYYYYNYLQFGLSGATVNNPFIVYYKTLTGTTKYTYTYDAFYSIELPNTKESSYKNFYFSGNLNAVLSLDFANWYYDATSYYKGDLVELLEQFPNLNHFRTDVSLFNQNLTNVVFPKLQYFQITDSTISGDVGTIKNFNGIEDLLLTDCVFDGNLTNINFTKLTQLSLNELSYLRGNLNDLFNNNPKLNWLNLTDCYLFSGNTTTIDVSKLIYINLSLTNSPQITGSITNWTFNTGLTNIYLSNKYLDGDISNWDFSNTHCSEIYLQNDSLINTNIHGSLSGWTLPNTLQSFNMINISGITSLPTNFTNCTNLGEIQVYYIKTLQSINDIHFNNNINYIYFNDCNLTGDIGTYIMPSGVTLISMQYNKIGGNFPSIMFNTKIQTLSLSGNLLNGNIAGMVFPDSLQLLDISSNSGITLNLSVIPYVSGATVGVFHTNKLTQLQLYSISGITGNLSNLIIDNNMYLSIYNTNANCDLSKLNPAKIYSLYAQNCPNLHGNLTNWLTGTTILSTLCINDDYILSGDTTNWNVNNVDDLQIPYTNLSGKLKQNNVYYLVANNTKISSNIKTDFNFSNRAYYVNLSNCTGITGNLSGVTLSTGIYYFDVRNNPNIFGSNKFIDYLFTNRKNFTFPYTVYINIYGIGDTVTGGTQQLGDTGTFPLGTGGTGQWNLTESQVNYLVAGLDYTGSGSTTSWTQGQKVYWMEFAKISSTNLNNRYIYYSINY